MSTSGIGVPNRTIGIMQGQGAQVDFRAGAIELRTNSNQFRPHSAAVLMGQRVLNKLPLVSNLLATIRIEILRNELKMQRKLSQVFAGNWCFVVGLGRRLDGSIRRFVALIAGALSVHSGIPSVV